MALWGNTDTEVSLPKYLTDEQLKNVIFVDLTEAADPDTKAKGITGPGYWLYESRTDSSGAVRHKAELLIPMRVSAANAGDRVKSDANLEVVDTYVLDVTTQPASSSVTAPTAASFNVVAAISAGGGTISYQWQEAPSTSRVFVDVSNAGVFTGATTATLAISDSTGLNKHKYRCIVTATNAVSETSKFATLTVA